MLIALLCLQIRLKLHDFFLKLLYLILLLKCITLSLYQPLIAEVKFELRVTELVVSFLFFAKHLCFFSVHLIFNLPDFRLQLTNQLRVLLNQTVFLSRVLIKLSALVKNDSVNSFNLKTIFFVFILHAIQLVFKLINPAFHISGSAHQLRFKFDLSSFNLSFLICLCLVDLSDKLLLLQGNPVSFKLHYLKFLSVLTAQFLILLLTFFELTRLVLKFIVDCHNLLQVSMHSLGVLLQLPVYSFKLSIFLTKYYALLSQILFIFCKFFHALLNLISARSLLSLISFSGFFIKDIFFLKQRKLLLVFFHFILILPT